MDVLGALVGIYRLEIDHVAHDMKFVGNAVSTVHVAADAGDIQCLEAVVALDQGDGFWSRSASIHHTSARNAACSAKAMSVCILASLNWMS